MNPNSPKEDSNKLLKLLGVGFGIAVTVGGTIGTGILRKPGPIAANLGDPALIMLVWALVSLYAFLGVLCTIELGVSVPRAGAWYVYARRAFGDYVGFVTGITSWLGTVAALGFGAYTMSEYIALIWPNTDPIIRWMAISILFILMCFHWLGTKSAGKSQEIMSFLKAVGLFAFVFMCFVYGGEVKTQELVSTTQRVAKPALLTGLIVALQQVFYTFDGWHTAAYFTEENTDPAKNLPKSMISGVLVVISIYLLVNLAILYIMPIEVLATSKLAAADAIRLIFGEKSGKIVTFFLMVSILGMLNAQIMFAPRVIYSMSKDGLFLKLAQKVNSGGTPAFAMPLTGICSILLIISGKDTCERLSDIATFFFVMTYAAGFASVIMLRKKEPNLPRPYKVIGYPYIPFILIIISVMFLIGAIYQDLNSSIYALVFLIFSYPLFLMTKKINL
ncbi:amino acid permease-associated region [Emticicia oligotrophica DSM 17448]|uniref:Amino acid permease-associated region n=1 Tax=Emticicia oligotrophica (strain DSM 17448 / CIP 109782 / MTCC 6937 / GPTSA100-15) TaxID=929562 RepID=A0ABM5N276_EMTOG|nr:amino acid permease [Emticicia oligotrophica]AFK03438.1 amino acid permease-associated region [Emticicia oligotrophica DSM 17448]